jgi:hypothetical protein
MGLGAEESIPRKDCNPADLMEEDFESTNSEFFRSLRQIK